MFLCSAVSVTVANQQLASDAVLADTTLANTNAANQKQTAQQDTHCSAASRTAGKCDKELDSEMESGIESDPGDESNHSNDVGVFRSRIRRTNSNLSSIDEFINSTMVPPPPSQPAVLDETELLRLTQSLCAPPPPPLPNSDDVTTDAKNSDETASLDRTHSDRTVLDVPLEEEYAKLVTPPPPVNPAVNDEADINRLLSIIAVCNGIIKPTPATSSVETHHSTPSVTNNSTSRPTSIYCPTSTPPTTTDISPTTLPPLHPSAVVKRTSNVRILTRLSSEDSYHNLSNASMLNGCEMDVDNSVSSNGMPHVASEPRAPSGSPGCLSVHELPASGTSKDGDLRMTLAHSRVYNGIGTLPRGTSMPVPRRRPPPPPPPRTSSVQNSPVLVNRKLRRRESSDSLTSRLTTLTTPEPDLYSDGTPTLERRDSTCSINTLNRTALIRPNALRASFSNASTYMANRPSPALSTGFPWMVPPRSSSTLPDERTRRSQSLTDSSSMASSPSSGVSVLAAIRSKLRSYWSTPSATKQNVELEPRASDYRSTPDRKPPNFHFSPLAPAKPLHEVFSHNFFDQDDSTSSQDTSSSVDSVCRTFKANDDIGSSAGHFAADLD